VVVSRQVVDLDVSCQGLRYDEASLSLFLKTSSTGFEDIVPSRIVRTRHSDNLRCVFRVPWTPSGETEGGSQVLKFNVYDADDNLTCFSNIDLAKLVERAFDDDFSSYKLRKLDGEAMDDVMLLVDIERVGRKEEADKHASDPHLPAAGTPKSERENGADKDERSPRASGDSVTRPASAVKGAFELSEDLHGLQVLADGIAAGVSDGGEYEYEEDYNSDSIASIAGSRGADAEEKEEKPTSPPMKTMKPADDKWEPSSGARKTLSEEAAMRKRKQMLRQQLADYLLGRHDSDEEVEQRARSPLPYSVTDYRRSRGGMPSQTFKTSAPHRERERDSIFHSGPKEPPRNWQMLQKARARNIINSLDGNFIKERRQRLRRGKAPGTKFIKRGDHQSRTMTEAIRNVHRYYDTQRQDKEIFMTALQTSFHAQRKYVHPSLAIPRKKKYCECLSNLTAPPAKRLTSRVIKDTNKSCVVRLYDGPERRAREKREREHKEEERRARLRPKDYNEGELACFARMSGGTKRQQEKEKEKEKQQKSERRERRRVETEATQVCDNHGESEREKQEEAQKMQEGLDL
jgi:hypothetical protein